MVPKKCFFTKGVGVHKERLASFELALRTAGLAYCNLVLVSSIYPPFCKRISKEEGTKLLRPGEIVFCVYDRESSNEPNRLVAASVEWRSPPMIASTATFPSTTLLARPMKKRANAQKILPPVCSRQL